METNQHYEVSRRRRYIGLGLGFILFTGLLLQPLWTTAQEQDPSADQVIDIITDHAGDLATNEEIQMIKELIDKITGATNTNTLTKTDVLTETIPAFNSCLSIYNAGSLALLDFVGFIDLDLPAPSDPISMNTVRNGNIVKTIHAEKEVFLCLLKQGDIPVIVEMTIIGEIFEDMTTTKIIKKQAEVITCMKLRATGGIVGCKMETPPTGFTPKLNCDDSVYIILSNVKMPLTLFGIELLPTHPQEMNTVSKNKTVKTIESQKEIFLCDIDQSNDLLAIGIIFPFNEMKVDLVVFTDIWEDLGNLPTNPTVKTEFLGLSCEISLMQDGDKDGNILIYTPDDNVPSVVSCMFTTIPN